MASNGRRVNTSLHSLAFMIRNHNCNFPLLYISGSVTSNVTLSSVSSATGKAKISPENRSPIICNSTDDNEDIEEDHDGAHDTITSLAGAKMLQRYRRAMSGSHKGSSSSISQVIDEN